MVPCVLIGNPNSEIKFILGFLSENQTLLCMIIICNGDIDLMEHNNSKLTCFETWFMRFEFPGGKLCVDELMREVAKMRNK